MEPASKWTDTELSSDAVSKKMIVEFLQANASSAFLSERKLVGKVDNVAKANGKDALVKTYHQLYETKAFRNPEEEAKKDAEKAAAAAAAAPAKPQEKVEAKKEEKKEEKVGYTKEVLKKGDGTNFPKKGDGVSCRYKGTLTNGKVFDSNMGEGKKAPPPLKFKVGVGKVIKGWDHALQTMSVGEVARLKIEPEWAYLQICIFFFLLVFFCVTRRYGKKGVEGAIPPNSVLVFEVELLSID